MDKLFIYGSGGLGRGVLNLIEDLNKIKKTWHIEGFLDDDKSIHGEFKNEKKVLGDVSYLLREKERSAIVVAIASPVIKAKIVHRIKGLDHVYFPNIIHPSVSFSKYNEIGEGNIISSNASISTNVRVGNYSLIHYNCSIGHDAIINDYVAIYPNSSVGGYTEIKDGAIIGSNATILPEKIIGDQCVVGAGAAVIHDLPEKCTAVGVPAKIIRRSFL
ncbi:MAG: hypothetical protein ACFWTY_06190 [Shouchella clausii]|jgi:sugar O-acyltransferase (sialic acid O-acetyltransferase NeuD family)